MKIRYEDMKIDRALTNAYTEEIKKAFNLISGQDDIELLLRGFEKKFSDYIGRRHALAVNSGTDAIHLCLTMLGIKSGDEVIMPNVTYPAVPIAVSYRGARPVFVDVDRESLNMDARAVEKALTKKTKVIIAAHMFAMPCDIKKISDIAKRHNIKVIEDVCQAESSTLDGKKLGSFGDFGCFSYSYYKPLSSCGGGGGAIVFDNELYKDIYKYTQIWRDEKSQLNARVRFAPMYLLDLISVEVKFKYLLPIIKSRQRAKKIYEQELCKVKGITIFKDKPNANSVPQNFVILSNKRDSLNSYMKCNSVICQQPYKPLHISNTFKEFSKGSKFPVSDMYWKKALHLPLYSFITEKEVKYVAKLVKDFYKRKPADD
ncbi:MAG: DegT/DnrJ/EryC1/StrS family aminotransferase [Dehalococcoidia bacterium]|nr:MAG: DegT/DnrJ/EryC1/StrS family aminotransferase [Dehalococcoidia bacterium]